MFVAVSWGAVVFALWGLMSIVLDRELVSAEVVPYYGLVSFALAGLAVWLAVAQTAAASSPWPLAITVTTGVYLVMVGWAALAGLPLLVEQAGSPFVLVAAATAGVTVVASWSGIRRWGPGAAPDTGRAGPGHPG